jgi:hypothetical protein
MLAIDFLGVTAGLACQLVRRDAGGGGSLYLKEGRTFS